MSHARGRSHDPLQQPSDSETGQDEPPPRDAAIYARRWEGVSGKASAGDFELDGLLGWGSTGSTGKPTAGENDDAQQGFHGFQSSAVHRHRRRVHSSTSGRCDPFNPRNPLDRSSRAVAVDLAVPRTMRRREESYRAKFLSPTSRRRYSAGAAPGRARRPSPCPGRRCPDRSCTAAGPSRRGRQCVP